MTWWRFQPGLSPGDAAPGFDLLDEEGKRQRLGDYRGRWLVVFFYPRDNSPVCLKEACAFNDQWEQFRELGAEILGVSAQDAASHLAMRAACRLRYRLLCDVDSAMRSAWLIPMSLGLGVRVTYLVDPGGAVRFVYNNLIRGEDHASLTLAFLKQAVSTNPGGDHHGVQKR
ncbi:MAG TPA: peroxiredoxin [bacterium]|jgi:peroxiredoxin Q/BCP|nr:peroxiredoxin [bacterium]